MSKPQVNIINIYPKDICVQLEISQKALNYLLDFLNGSEVTFNEDDDPEFAKAVKYVRDELFPMLDELSDTLKTGGIA